MPRTAGFLAILIFAMGAANAPVPRQKPAGDAVPQAAAIPIPRPKPHPGLAAPAEPAQSPAEEGQEWPAQSVAGARKACRDALVGLDVDYVELKPIGAEGGCGAPAPVELQEVAGVRIAPPAELNCAMVVALHGWVTKVVQPAARTKLNTEVTAIRNAAAYVCRSRNNIKGGKLSEHARANALDMSGFSFAGGDDATVGDGWGGFLQALGMPRPDSFLEIVRTGACGHFTTVLGPGSDPYHGSHFHLDAIQRKNGGRICK